MLGISSAANHFDKNMNHSTPNVVKKFSEYDEQPFVLEFFKDTPAGFYVDVGANNGWKGSNTWALALQGWSGLLVEADTNTYAELVKTCRDNPKLTPVWGAVWNFDGHAKFYQHNIWCSGLSSLDPGYRGATSVTETEVPVMTLDTLLEDYKITQIDFLAIDAERCDYDIVQDYSFMPRPKLIMIEHGDALQRFDEVFALRSYRRIFTSIGNAAYA